MYEPLNGENITEIMQTLKIKGQGQTSKNFETEYVENSTRQRGSVNRS